MTFRRRSLWDLCAEGRVAVLVDEGDQEEGEGSISFCVADAEPGAATVESAAVLAPEIVRALKACHKSMRSYEE